MIRSFTFRLLSLFRLYRLPVSFRPVSLSAPIILLSAIIPGLISSCAAFDNQNAYTPPAGYIYQNSTMNVMMTPGSEIGSRTGEACAESYLGLFSTGEAGIKQAAAAGAILNVKAIDYRIVRFFGIGYVKVCTIAYGD
jgi:hypothetical protein